MFGLDWSALQYPQRHNSVRCEMNECWIRCLCRLYSMRCGWITEMGRQVYEHEQVRTKIVSMISKEILGYAIDW